MSFFAAIAPAALSLLLRCSLFAAGILGLALLLDRLRLRLRPAVRHGLVMGALGLAASAPVWLALGQGAAAQRLGGDHPGRASALIADEPVGATSDAGSLSLPIESVRRVWSRLPAGAATGALWIWGAGLLWGLLRIGQGVRQVRGLVRRARPVDEPRFARALGRDNPKAAPVLISDEVDAAVVVGFLRPVIVLAAALARMPGATLDQILLHERAHVRRRDPLWGLLQRIVTSVYWFHPLVHLAGRAMARSREEACDDDVIARHQPTDYAQTLLALATTGAQGRRRLPGGAMHIRSGIEGRIRRIVAPPATSGGLSEAARITAVSAGLLLLGGPLAMALAPPGPESGGPQLEPAVALADQNQSPFHRASPRTEGAFVVRDLRRGRTLVLNPGLAQQRVTPASTFKVIIALFALETAAVRDEHFTLPWDGARNEMESWNRDLDLRQAMQVSANWYFEELLGRLDRGQVLRSLRQIRYGNGDGSGDVRRFWIDGPLRISALEQVDVMARLASGKLGTSAHTDQVLLAITQLERHAGATLYGKTGTALVGEEVIAWLVGHSVWGEEHFAYATLLRAPAGDSDALRARRLEITRALLVRQGAYPAE